MSNYSAKFARFFEWELHDDLQKKTRKVSEQKSITPHILVYIQP
jgi:hypothetical protein